jgi:hypothetical protein
MAMMVRANRISGRRIIECYPEKGNAASQISAHFEHPAG